MPKTGILAALLAVSAAAGAELSVDFDPAKTKIEWTLVGNVHTVHGTFRLKQGHVTVDTVSGAASGALESDAASGESGNGIRDKRMQKDVLESQRFPDIRLTPHKVAGSVKAEGKSVIQVVGTISIHGAEHEVTVPMTVTMTGQSVAGIGRFAIPYVDWGMKDPSNFLFKVGKSVDLEITAIGTVASK